MTTGLDGNRRRLRGGRRKNAGRKPSGKKVFAIRLRPEDVAEFDAAAKEIGIPKRTDAVGEAMRLALIHWRTM